MQVKNILHNTGKKLEQNKQYKNICQMKGTEL